jgi:hypothetical protein
MCNDAHVFFEIASTQTLWVGPQAAVAYAYKERRGTCDWTTVILSNANVADNIP